MKDIIQPPPRPENDRRASATARCGDEEKLQRGKTLPDDDAVWVDVVILLFVCLCAVVGIIGVCKALTAIFN